ncbi:MAG: hypothetical protein V1825_00510 [Candidatus Falkowbacteria bacterium]|nr:hypothetical protein [Candidatus Parcubacteria bacterium]
MEEIKVCKAGEGKYTIIINKKEFVVGKNDILHKKAKIFLQFENVRYSGCVKIYKMPNKGILCVTTDTEEFFAIEHSSKQKNNKGVYFIKPLS